MSGYEVDYSKQPDPEKEPEERANAFGVASDLLGGTPLGNFLSFGADYQTYQEGVKQVEEANRTGGIGEMGRIDKTIGFLGMVTDGLGVLDWASGMVDTEPPFGDIAAVTGTLQGGAEMFKGVLQIADGDRLGEGQMIVDGIADGIGGIKDVMSSSADPRMAVAGKLLGVGMAGGDALAPMLMGDLDQNVDVQQSDGDWVPSTGWGVSDWVFGAGKYTDSRWSADGKSSGELRQEQRNAKADQLIAENPDANPWDLAKKMAGVE